jgi:hypothetical protein
MKYLFWSQFPLNYYEIFTLQYIIHKFFAAFCGQYSWITQVIFCFLFQSFLVLISY